MSKKTSDGLKILFITRKYPPTVGGMETAAHELHEALAVDNDVRLIKWGGSKVLLPLVYPWLFFRGLLSGWLWRPDAIYLQDGLLAPMGAMFKWLTGRPTVLTLHGLDVTYRNPVFQILFRIFAKANSELVTVSQATKSEVVARTGRRDVSVINNGVNDEFYIEGPRAKLQAELAVSIGLDAGRLANSKLLLSSGRLVKRKGVAWFLENVLPGLAKANAGWLYLVSGDGPERLQLEKIVANQKLSDNVKLVGYVDAETRRLLYSVADLFVMPNVPVPGDPEGFGIVAIEASSCGTPVVAARLGGIADAVIDGSNGFLAKPQDAAAFIKVISRELAKPSLDRASVRQFTLGRYSWAKAANQYGAIMKGLVKP